VQAVCDWCGPTDLERWVQFKASFEGLGADYPNEAVTKLLGGPIDELKTLAQSANPITFVSADSPPFLMMHGDQDNLVPLEQSELLHRALQNFHEDVELRILPDRRHESYEDAASLRQVEAFFNRTLWNSDEEQAVKDVRLVASYIHQPGNLPPRTIEFYSNGRLESPESPNTWLLRGNQLALCWYTSQAKPFGVFVDICTLSKDGKIYQGRNQAGAAIHGEKSSGDNLKTADRSKGSK